MTPCVTSKKNVIASDSTTISKPPQTQNQNKVKYATKCNLKKTPSLRAIAQQSQNHPQTKIKTK